MLAVASTQLEGAVARRLHVGLAHSASDILAAQQLRYRVFAEEMGARLPSRIAGVDHDHFDAHCQHLVVRDQERDKIVGTYRLLTPEAARRVGAYYSETEFDITRFLHLRPRLVEVGRSCVDPEYRTGAAIGLLWTGLTQFMTDNGYEYMMGCASISMRDGGHNAANIYSRLQDKYLCPPEYRAFARNPLPVEQLVTDAPAQMPALLKAYLRAGSEVCSAPAWDPDFNTADLLLLIARSRFDPRRARHMALRG